MNRAGNFEIGIQRFGGEGQAAVFYLPLVAGAGLGIQLLPPQRLSRLLGCQRIQRVSANRLDWLVRVMAEPRRWSALIARSPRQASIIQRSGRTAAAPIKVDLLVGNRARRPVVGRSP